MGCFIHATDISMVIYIGRRARLNYSRYADGSRLKLRRLIIAPIDISAAYRAKASAVADYGRVAAAPPFDRRYLAC